MEIDLDKEPQEGEVLIFTLGGGFSVKGTVKDVVHALSTEEWPTFALSESGAEVVLRSSHVVALRGGTQHKRGSIGFVAGH
jgi:hypothetical protein